MNEEKNLYVLEDAIVYGEEKIIPPFQVEKLLEIFGEARIGTLKFEQYNFEDTHYYWDDLGLEGIQSNKAKYIGCIRVHIWKHPDMSIRGSFHGKLFIKKKEYTDCKWKFDSASLMQASYKVGCFELHTFMIEHINDIEEKYRKSAERLSANVEIDYNPPRKLVKYKLKKIEEPELVFSDFNFKLAVIQKLMYEKELLLPKFDVDEFAEEYDKREIDTIDEGDEPIREVVNWFKKLQIPVSLADEIDEIHMDGGDEIYHQIIPYWDGEDDYFDIKKITKDDILQFKNLKKMSLMAKNIKKIKKDLEGLDIVIESL